MVNGDRGVEVALTVRDRSMQIADTMSVSSVAARKEDDKRTACVAALAFMKANRWVSFLICSVVYTR